MFAPDWTLSTTRAAYKAFQPNNTLSTKLHRRYVYRSALYYFTVAEAMNYAFSGHSILENDDPTRIDMGDGRTMQFSKHAMEPIHWITDTSKQLYNKLGYIPKELVAQKELRGETKEEAPGILKRLGHAAKGLVPIGAQSTIEKETSLQTYGEAALSFLGMPIYGKTVEQKKEDKRTKREELRIKRETRRRERRERE